MYNYFNIPMLQKKKKKNWTQFMFEKQFNKLKGKRKLLVYDRCNRLSHITNKSNFVFYNC